MTRPDRTCDTVSLGEFTFECGRTLPLDVAYETYGEFTGDNAVLVCHALTGSQHVTGADGGDGGTDAGSEATATDQASAWWADVVGPGRPIDTREQFVVCANVPGSCYGTTGPASTNPETGDPYGSDFPPVSVTDWTRAQAELLDYLGIERLRAVVGGSVGGMNALEWAKIYPERVETVIPVATAARLDAQLLGVDAVARRAITTDPAWSGGDYYGDGPDPDEGLALARQLGHLTYLSKESMARKFGRERAGDDARAAFAPETLAEAEATESHPYREVESYLDYQASRFVERFDANSYLLLSRAMDDYDLAAGHNSDADALADFSGEVLVVSVTGDWHFTVEQGDHLAATFEAAGATVEHHVLDSDHGHDAFLVEPDAIGPPLRDAIEGNVGCVGCTDGGYADREFAPVHASLFGD